MRLYVTKITQEPTQNTDHPVAVTVELSSLKVPAALFRPGVTVRIHTTEAEQFAQFKLGGEFDVEIHQVTETPTPAP